MNPITWRCPTCGCDNEDSFTETVEPECSECESTFPWSDLLQPAEWYAFNLQAAEEAKK